MKILLITANFFKAEGSIAKGIAASLVNHEVYFFSMAEIKYRKDEFLALQIKVDIVHWLYNVAHINSEQKQYYLDTSRPKIATVHHVCEQEINKIEEASHADLIQLVSSEWKTFVESHTSTPVALAYLGIHSQDFKGLKALPYHGGEVVIGLMGFYPGKYNRKRLDVALDVFKHLKETKLPFRVLVQGGGWDEATQFFVEENIPFERKKVTSGADILKFFEHIHIYLCTSDYEGGPLPVLEALQIGVPVVSTDIGMARDALKQGGGILCPKENVLALSNAIRKISESKSLHQKISQEGPAIASTFFWENVIEGYEKMYRKAIQEWEHTHHSTLEISATTRDAADQRRRELAYDAVQEAFVLLYGTSKTKGAILTFSSLLQKQISFSRRIDIFKKASVFLLTGRKN